MSDRGRGKPREKRKIVDLDAPSVPMKKSKQRAPFVPRQSPRLSGVKISKNQFDAIVEIGSKQPTINMHGGVGIPGGRTLEDVVKFTPFNFKKIKVETRGILRTSKKLREMRSATIEDKRKEVEKVNRKVVYSDTQMGTHSLHVGNDIVAVYNKTKSKVYDYPDLAMALDKRLESAQSLDGGKDYWKSSKTLPKRRSHIAQGMQHLIAGDNVTAHQSFEEAGLTSRGLKWVQKMSSLMLSERGRELHGKGGTAVHTALQHVRGNTKTPSKSFTDVFVTHAITLAPFANRGGAKTFK